MTTTPFRTQTPLSLTKAFNKPNQLIVIFFILRMNFFFYIKTKRTWNTDTIAHKKLSKLLREVTSFPSAFLNMNFPPNKFIPRIANANMKRNSNPKNVITLVIVLTTTSNWYRTGLTSLKIRSNRILRNIEREESFLVSRISQTLQNYQ